MPKVRPETLRDIETALRRYETEVWSAGLTESTAKTYLLHVQNFVRWLKDDFIPGDTLPTARRVRH